MIKILFGAALSLVAALSFAASAQDRRPSHCIALADATPGIEFLHKANWSDALPDDFTVRINYVEHATFLLQIPGGLSVATDYTGYLGQTDHVPDIVTMNHAHASHWTSRPDPRIPNVLPGWRDDGGPAEHHLELGELLVRNVPTDIRSRFGAGIERNGNSIFVFEAGGLCIGHLGHLHHEPNAQQYATLGRLDVVMAAVDGGVSLDLPTMMRVLRRLKSSIVIPMHWFSTISLGQFLDGMSDEFDVERSDSSSIEVSLRTLPDRPTIVVLRPSYLRETPE